MTIRCWLAAACLMYSACLPAANSERWVLIHAGTLITSAGAQPLRHVSIGLRNDRIAFIREGFVAAETLGSESGAVPVVVDLRDFVVLPGLIDSHVHLTMSFGPDAKLEEVTKTGEARALDGAFNALRTLHAGFTSVRDVGGDTEAILALRDAIDSGRLAGPRIVAAGAALSPTGGHADANGFRPGIMAPRPGVCDGPESCRAAVRALVKRGVDVVKMMATGGVLDDSPAGIDQHFTDAEMQAIVDTAHQLGRKVAAHAHGAKGIAAALRAGADSIEHATFLDAGTAAVARRRGVYVVPALLAPTTALALIEKNGVYSDAIREKARQAAPLITQALAVARRSGVRVAFGSDSGVSRHGCNARELSLLVEAGLSPAEALHTSLDAAADLLGLRAELGSIEAGKIADLIAVEGNPLLDAGALGNVVFVMKSGRIYKSPRLAQENESLAADACLM